MTIKISLEKWDALCRSLLCYPDSSIDVLIHNATHLQKRVFDLADYTGIRHKRLGLIPFNDGDKWCVLYGVDLQEGKAAFGNTPEEAIVNFDATRQGRFYRDTKL